MANYCEVCFREIDLLNPCAHQRASGSGDFEFVTHTADETHQQIRSFIWAAPFAGILLDAFWPVWTNVLTAIISALLAGAFVLAYWVSRNIKMSGATIGRNVPLFLLPPFAFRAFDHDRKSENTRNWALAFVAAVVLQLAFVGPGNFKALQDAITAETVVNGNAGLPVNCPTVAFLPVGGSVICEVETGLLALTIPARIEISPLAMKPEVKVALN